MPTRRTLMRAALGSALVTAGCSASHTKSTPKAMDKVTHVTGFGASGSESFSWVAQAKGFFKEVNIDVTISPGAAGDVNLSTVQSGKAQFTEIDYAGALVRGGQPGKFDAFRCVAAIHWQTQIAWIALANNGINTAADLAHKTVAEQAGSVHKTLFPIYAKLAGFDPATVKWADGTAATMPGMLGNKNVDAIGQFVVSAPTIKGAVKHDVVVLPYGQYLTDLYGSVLVTTNDLLTKNPDLVHRYTNALLKGLQYTVQNPHEAATILKAAVPTTDVEVAAAAAGGLAPYVRAGQNGAALGALDQERVARGIALLQGLGAFQSGYDPTKVCNFTMVDANGKSQ